MSSAPCFRRYQVAEDTQPEPDDASEGKICTHDFDSLCKGFPDLATSVSSTTLMEVRELKRTLATMKQELDALKGSSVKESRDVKKEE